MTTLSSALDNIKHLFPSGEELNLDQLTGGYSNQVYCLGWLGLPQLVVRVPGLDEALFDIHRFAEKRALLQAEKLSLTPPVLYFDEHSGLLVSKFVRQQPFEWDVYHRDEDVLRLAHCLRQIHDMEDNGADYHLSDIILHYITSARRFENRPEEELDWLERQFSQEIERIPPYEAVMCHNDLNPKNCLVDPLHFWVIDWEYAGIGDPLFDIAIVIASHNLSEAQTEKLLAAYNDQILFAEVRPILQAYVRLYAIREMSWLLLKHVSCPQDFEAMQCYYAFKQAYIEEAPQLAGSPVDAN